jgi:hypothetical protein
MRLLLTGREVALEGGRMMRLERAPLPGNKGRMRAARQHLWGLDRLEVGCMVLSTQVDRLVGVDLTSGVGRLAPVAQKAAAALLGV